ncbi:MAG: DUF2071 domain-containing protein [Acidobacteriota bacterium]|jgi:hypothetical protein
MILRTKVRDCLYLNWAVPADSAPPLPEPLRYQTVHGPAGGDRGDGDGRVDRVDQAWAFASALLFHHDGLRVRGLPLIRLSYPQLHVRHYVVDPEGRPAVYLRRMLVPLWVVPGVRLLGGQPARPGRLSFASPSREPEPGRWRWRVRGRRGLDLVGERAAPRVGEGPDLGTWRETVRFFRERRRAYAGRAGHLRMIETTQPDVPLWPMRIDLEDDALVRRALATDPLPALHSAWLCPEILMTFELAPEAEPDEPVRRRVPAAG